ncbi:MAG: type II toxin-antitoxin system VapC family toxin, partial [Actinobacteria bacterium]|nr:type II toxin-antitoxin system VapC family toxin [Actinomycetota bacterium]
MIVYFEASALVKLLVEESGSSVAAALWDKADRILTSRLTYPESRAAIAAAVRDGRALPASADAAKDQLEARWQQVEVIEVESDIAFAAGA